MKLSEWARKNDITYRTAWLWFHAGYLPVRATQLETGTILVFEDEPKETTDSPVAIYCRVSGHDQKDDLERQAERLKGFASANGWVVAQTVAEIGSGLNGKRPKLLKLLSDPKVGVILVEHKDRLTRFGFEYLEAALNAHRRKVIVADQDEQDLDIWQDFIDLVTSMCARIYGKRGAKNRAKKAIETIRNTAGQTNG